MAIMTTGEGEKTVAVGDDVKKNENLGAVIERQGSCTKLVHSLAMTAVPTEQYTVAVYKTEVEQMTGDRHYYHTY